MNYRSWELQSKKKESKSRQGIWALAGSTLAILLTVAATSSAGKDAPGEVETRFQITVRVYNYAGATSGTLLRGEEEGTRIFRKAGVEVVWLECSISPSPEGQAPPCQTPLGTITVNLRILPPSMAARFESSREEMGFALVSARAGSASDAWVFYQRVEDAAASEFASRSQILAYAMAHEIGHLLLGPDHHSREGIMCARWNQESLEEVSQGQMLFSRDQAQLIRNQVKTRTEMAQERITGRHAPREVAAIRGK
jgi:hypothetical protein